MQETIPLEDLTCLVVVLGGVGLTALTLWECLLDRKALIKAGVNGLRRHVVRQDVRHELLRLIKHLVLAAALLAAPTGLGRVTLSDPVAAAVRDRNLAIAIVSLLMAANSLLDLRGRRRGIRELKKRTQVEPPHHDGETRPPRQSQ
jgi:hypothetical protein